MEGLGGAGTTMETRVTERNSGTTGTGPDPRRVILIGANPGVRLFDGGRLTAYASVWRVDWSPHGRGTALVLWADGAVRVIGDPAGLARWLERSFVRFFPEVDGLSWPEPEVEPAAVHINLDLAHGLRAQAADVEVRVSGVLDRRSFSTDEFDLGGRKHGLSLVIAPCSAASIHRAGLQLPGNPRVDGSPERPSSTCFLTDAEVWWS